MKISTSNLVSKTHQLWSNIFVIMNSEYNYLDCPAWLPNKAPFLDKTHNFVEKAVREKQLNFLAPSLSPELIGSLDCGTATHSKSAGKDSAENGAQRTCHASTHCQSRIFAES